MLLARRRRLRPPAQRPARTRSSSSTARSAWPSRPRAARPASSRARDLAVQIVSDVAGRRRLQRRAHEGHAGLDRGRDRRTMPARWPREIEPAPPCRTATPRCRRRSTWSPPSSPRTPAASTAAKSTSSPTCRSPPGWLPRDRARQEGQQGPRDNRPSRRSQKRARTIFVDVGRDDVNNLAVTDLSLGDPLRHHRRDWCRSRPRSRTSATEPRQQVRVELLVGRARTTAKDPPFALRVVDTQVIDARCRAKRHGRQLHATSSPRPAPTPCRSASSATTCELDDARTVDRHRQGHGAGAAGQRQAGRGGSLRPGHGVPAAGAQPLRQGPGAAPGRRSGPGWSARRSSPTPAETNLSRLRLRLPVRRRPHRHQRGPPAGGASAPRRRRGVLPRRPLGRATRSVQPPAVQEGPGPPARQAARRPAGARRALLRPARPGRGVPASRRSRPSPTTTTAPACAPVAFRQYVRAEAGGGRQGSQGAVVPARDRRPAPR